LALALGDWAPLPLEGNVLAYSRVRADQCFIIVLNLESSPKAVRFAKELRGSIVLSTHLGRAGECISDRLDLSCDEGVIIKTQGSSRLKAG